MSEITIFVVDADDVARTLSVATGLSLMKALVANSISGIDATCGGECSCATCHVIVDPHWFAQLEAPKELESEMLEFAEDPQPTSRLSCQVLLSSDLDGMTLKVPDD